MSERSLTLRAINRSTLARRMLLARERVSALAAIDRLLAMQAQWPKPPFVGLWSRIEGFDKSELTTLARKKKLVRASTMRATIHLLSAKDYLRFRGALQPMLSRSANGIVGKRLKGVDLARLLEEARAFLDEAPRTFEEVRAHLQKRHPKADARAMGYAARLGLALVMCPTDAAWGWPANACFTTARSFLGRSIDEDDATKDLVRRYFAAFGPASIADAQSWSGLRNLKPIVESMRDELVTMRDDEKRELFDVKGAPRVDEDAPAPVRFLPDFDDMLLGYADRTRVVAEAHKDKVYGFDLRVMQTFLVDGFVAGTWRVDRKGARATISVAPFAAIDRETRDALADEGERLARFSEEDATSIDVRFTKG